MKGTSFSLSFGSSLGGGQSNEFTAVPSWWETLTDDKGDDESGIFGLKEANQKDAVVFLADCSKGMFLKLENGEIPWKQLIKLCGNVYRDKIISNAKDLVGICFYGTREEKNNQGFENIYVYHPLDEPSAHKIKELNQLSDIKSSKKKLDLLMQMNQRNRTSVMRSGQLSQCSVKEESFGSKRIFIFTGNDNPNESDPDIQQQAQAKSQDLEQFDIEIEIFPLGSTLQTFDVMKFFHRIKTFSIDETTGKPDFRPRETIEELQQQVRKKEFKKRALASMPLAIGPGVWIAIKLFVLQRIATKPTPSWLDAKRMNHYRLSQHGFVRIQVRFWKIIR
eukprot:TRINITY_DN415_c0_g1_i2.p1 TRINITY_DN415_c0_g1~~TRINITY_DN415_c0_g1_i2.p1  ORF type:complete len:388 (-),score=101.33 TRINITY_DN415_c0_g1_i2:994-1998(-)